MPEIIVTLGDNVVNKYVFDKDVMSIGRSRDNDVCIENLAVSRNHARIRREDDSFFLSDLNSANGTFVNGVQITKTELFNDDVVTIGKHKLIFKHEALSDEALISDAFGAERTMIVDVTPDAVLTVTRGKQKDMEFRLDKAEVTIGRGNDCDIVLHDWFVSKQHAEIHRQGNTYQLRDAGSWRGTKVNEVQITETVLKDGDEIQLGGTRVVFRLSLEEPGSKATGRLPQELAAPEPVQPAVAEEPAEASTQEAEPIRAGGEDDFIEAETQEPLDMVSEEETVKGAPLEDELRDGVEMMHEALEGEETPPESAEEAVVEAVPEPVAFEPEPDQAPEEPAMVEAEPEETPEMPFEEPSEQPAVEPEAEAVAEGEEPAPSEADPAQIRMWEQALENKSPAIRRQAAKMLKKLTGKDYDY